MNSPNAGLFYFRSKCLLESFFASAKQTRSCTLCGGGTFEMVAGDIKKLLQM